MLNIQQSDNEDDSIDSISPSRIRKPSMYPQITSQALFDSSSIQDWSELQEQLQIQYSTLNRETGGRNERHNQINREMISYFSTLLRHKDLQRKQIAGKDNPIMVDRSANQNMIHPQAGKLLDCSYTYMQSLFFTFVENAKFFAQILYSAFQNAEFHQSVIHLQDDFVYNFVNHLCDPCVGTGLSFGVLGVLTEMLEMELRTCERPQEFFERQGIASKLLFGFLKRAECAIYIQQVLSKPINLMLSVKESLEVNPKSVYDYLIQKKQQAEAREFERKNRRTEVTSKSKTLLQKLGEVLLSNKPEVVQKVIPVVVDQKSSVELPPQQPIFSQKIKKVIDQEDFNARKDKLNAIREEISTLFQIQRGGDQTYDEILVEETAQILYERRTAIDLVIRNLLRGIMNSMNRMPIVVRVIGRLLLQMFQMQFTMTPKEINAILTQFILNRWILHEFPLLLMRNCTSDLHGLQMANAGMIIRQMQSVWRGEVQFEGHGVQDVDKFFRNLVVPSEGQMKYYFRKDDDQRNYNSYLLSLADLQIMVNMISKSKLDTQDEKLKTQFNNLKKTSQTYLIEIIHYLYIQTLSLSSPLDFMKPTVMYLGQVVKANNLFFTLNKISDIFSVNYLDTTFKFVDIVSIKKKPKEEQESLLFIGKCKQVWVQFLLSIEKISQMSKLRHDVDFTFDNLIYMYKDAYEDKGINIKQYENISAQLYANYIISIFKVIPPNYKDNNLMLLCREIKQEFNQRLLITQKQISTFLSMFQQLMSNLASSRDNIRHVNRSLKKTILKKHIIIFFKQTKLPLRFSISNAQINIEKIDGNRAPDQSELNSFLSTTNGDDIEKMHAEIILYDIKDFIDVLSQMTLLKKAIIDGDEQLINSLGKTFSCFMTNCENRLEQEDFYKRLTTLPGLQWEYHKSLRPDQALSRRDWEIKKERKGKTQQSDAYEILERYITKRIVSKFHNIYTYNSPQNETFYKQCLQAQKQSLKYHGIDDLECEHSMLIMISESKNNKNKYQGFSAIDGLITPLEKLECVYQVLHQILSLLEISGEGSSNDGAERLKPIFIYIVIRAAPRRMITSLNLIKTLLNTRHWIHKIMDYSQVELESAIKSIITHNYCDSE